MQQEALKEAGITSSQVSGIVNAHDLNRRTPMGDQTLLSQYKMCNAINDEQLKGAKNIKDLVNINVVTLDKQLFVEQKRGSNRNNNGQLKTETQYNLQFDPINFLQKAPQMGDHDFMVNQAILHNSTMKNKVSEAFNRQRFSRQQQGQHQPPQTTKSTNGGLRRLLPELPIGGLSVKRPRHSRFGSVRSMRTSKNRLASQGGIDPNQMEAETQGMTAAEPEPEYEFDTTVQLSGRGSQIDPVRCLQSIFKKTDVKRRNPGINPVVEKYKQMAKSVRTNTRGTRTIGTANTFTSPAHEQAASYLGSVKDSVTSPTGEVNFFSQQPFRQSQQQPARAGLMSQGNEYILHQQEVSALSQKLGVPATAPMGASRPTHAKNNFDIQVVSPELNAANDSKQFQPQVQPAYNSFNKRQTMPIVANGSDQPSRATKQASYSSQPTAQEQMSRNTKTATHFSQRSTGQQQQPLVSPNISDELTQAQVAIREKLKAMKQLFEDEDNNNANSTGDQRVLGRPDSSEWDLHNHKIMYEEALEKRKRHLEIVEKRKETQGLEGESPKRGSKSNTNVVKSNAPHNFEMQEEELRDFLINRIADLKSQGDKDANEEVVQFKYKASTISNVLPSGHFREQMRLQENYKKRFTKGEKVHQKILNTQQRMIQKRNSVQRVSHLQAMEQCKKDVISSRSGRTRSPSTGSDGGSPTGIFNHRRALPPTTEHTTFSNSRSRQGRHQRGGTRQHQQQRINTDLDEAPVDEGMMPSSDVAYSTQKASMMQMQEMARQPAMTPQLIENRGDLVQNQERVMSHDQPFYQDDYPADGQQERQVMSDDQRESATKNIQMVSEGGDNSPKFRNEIDDGALLGAGPHSKTHEVDDFNLFKLDEGSIDEHGRRQNKYTQVMKKLGEIDKKFDKEQKLRKKGLGKEALEFLAQAKEDYKAEQAARYQEDQNIQEIQYMDKFETQKLSSYSLEGRENIVEELNNLVTKSFDVAQAQTPDPTVQQDDNKSQKAPSAVIIVQVSQHDTSNHSVNQSKDAKDKSVYTQEDGNGEVNTRKNSSMAAPSQQRRVQVVHSKSRSFSQTSNKPSVLKTTDERKSDDMAAAAEKLQTQTVQYNSGQNSKVAARESDYTGSGDQATPRTTSLVILNRGAQKYSQQNINTAKKDDDVEEPMTAARPNSGSGQNSLEVQSDNIDVQHTMEMESIGNKKQQQDQAISGFSNNGQSEPSIVGREDQVEDQGDAGSNHDLLSMPNLGYEMFPSNDINLAQSMVTGSQLSYFCPKRFNRFPRFTIFFKKGQKSAESAYITQNTVSLNSDFLKFLSNKNVSSPTAAQAAAKAGVPKTKNTETSAAPRTAKGNKRAISPTTTDKTNGEERTFSVTELNSYEKLGQSITGVKVPQEVEQWNEYLKQKKFDPFDRVVLVKGIDNSILTSFRTLKGDNNTVSDTFKIVHKKFAPSKTNNAFFKNIMTKHIDKLPYQTNLDYEELDEEEELGDFEIYEEKDDGTFEQIAIPEKHYKIDVDTNRQSQVDGKDQTQELSASKLQHAITSALIDMEKEATSTVRSSEKKSPPFKVLKTVEGINQINLDFKKEVESVENLSMKKRGTEQRMPRPKPLNIGKQQKKVSKQTSQDKLVMNPFGVQGVSPLTQLANNMLREQQHQVLSRDDTGEVQHTESSPGTIQVKSVLPTASPATAAGATTGGQNANNGSAIVTAQNSIYKIQEPTLTDGGDEGRRGIDQKKHSGGTLMIGQNFQFSSQNMGASNSNDYTKKSPSASKSQTGGRFLSMGSGGGVKHPNHRMHEVASMVAQPGKLTTMNQHSRQVSKESKPLVSESNTIQPRSSMNVVQEHSTKNQKNSNQLEKPITPISLHTIKHTMLMDGQGHSPGQPGYLGTVKRVQRFDPDESQGEIRDSQYTKAGCESESQNEMFTSLGDRVQAVNHQYSPKVNVITSKAPQVQSLASSIPIESAEAADGDTTKRTIVGGGGIYVLDNSVTFDNLDYFHNSPLVHQALGARKPKKAAAASKKVESLQPGSIIQYQSMSSPRSFEQPKGVGAACLSQRTAPEPAEHVGVLKVPDSLKAQHNSMSFGGGLPGENNVVETVAQTGAKQGAVSSMINKIYQKDRRMVNSMYKGNMLSTTVLTDLGRYHLLKSNTGVEHKEYDNIWLKERIEEEKQDIGLSLDCAPKLAAEAALQAQQGIIDEGSVTVFSKEANLAASQKEGNLRKSLKGQLGEGGSNHMKNSQENVDVAADNLNYGEMVNRSETGTALSKANYH